MSVRATVDPEKSCIFDTTSSISVIFFEVWD